MAESTSTAVRSPGMGLGLSERFDVMLEADTAMMDTGDQTLAAVMGDDDRHADGRSGRTPTPSASVSRSRSSASSRSSSTSSVKRESDPEAAHGRGLRESARAIADRRREMVSRMAMSVADVCDAIRLIVDSDKPIDLIGMSVPDRKLHGPCIGTNYSRVIGLDRLSSMSQALALARLCVGGGAWYSPTNLPTSVEFPCIMVIDFAPRGKFHRFFV